jgi:hypothetical protein
MSRRVLAFFVSCVFLASGLSFSRAATWVPIEGNVRLADGTPICAMVLANGQYTFSCDGSGAYNLNVPLDANGQVTLFIFADGFAPLSAKLGPNSFSFSGQMQKAAPNSPLIAMTRNVECASTPNWVYITGTIQSYGSQPLCAMVLSNGQQMFTCDDSLGNYDLTVPVDENGQVTVFGFADGFQPYSGTFLAPSCDNGGGGGSDQGASLILARSQSLAGITAGAEAVFLTPASQVGHHVEYPSLGQCTLAVTPFSTPPLITTLDAGPAIQLTRGDGVGISMPRNRSTPTTQDFLYVSHSSDPAFYEGGQSYVFSGTGGPDVGAFTTPPVVAPPALDLSTPTASAPPYIYYQDADKPLPLAWNGNGGNGAVEVMLSGASSTAAYMILCLFVDNGNAEVPATLLTQMREDLQKGATSVPSTGLTVDRRNSKIFETSQMKIDVTITSLAIVSVQLQ